MSKEKDINSEMTTHFLGDVENILLVQASNHPDLPIRQFNQGLIKYLESDPHFEAQIANIVTHRTNITSSHMADLMARSAQYLLRKESNNQYPSYSSDQFYEWFKNLQDDRLESYLELLETKNAATHIPERYRSLAAICPHLVETSSSNGLRVADFGCSGNLGLPAVLKPRYLLTGSLEDRTQGQLVRHLLEIDQVKYEHAVGVDSQLPDWEWITACAYFSKYEDAKAKYAAHRQNLSSHHIDSCQANIAASSPKEKANLKRCLTGPEGEKLHIAHSSMTLYQLPETARRQAMHNIQETLGESGLFVELTFENEKDWFGEWNIVTKVSQKIDGQLSSPLTWLEWDNSRCKTVRQGENFSQVCEMLRLTPAVSATQLVYESTSP